MSLFLGTKTEEIKASQGFPDILEIVEKSRSGEEPCDNLKFSENHRRCQPHGCGKCGDRIP